MKVRNARLWAPRGPRRWCIAAGALALASAIRFALHPLLGPMIPGTTFCIAASLVEYFLGLAPALTVMVLGLAIADYMLPGQVWFRSTFRVSSVMPRTDFRNLRL